MKAIATIAVAGLIAATSLTTTVTPADAGGNHWKQNNWNHNNNWKRPYQQNNYYYSSKGWNAGAALATGAILGLAFGALATPNTYYSPRVYTYAPPPPPPPAYPSYQYGYEYGYGPTDPQHVSWCSRKYRSYNVQYNTWVGYDGLVRQCVSPYS